MNVTDLVRRELLGEFRQTARERLERIGATWVSLESGETGRAEQGKVLLRELHTLKGEAKLMGFAHVSQLVHHVEDLVLTIERGGYRRADQVGDLVLRAVDVLGEQIANPPEAAASVALGALEARIATTRDQLGTAAPERPAPAPGAPEPVGNDAFVRVDAATAHHLAEEASEAVIAQSRYRHALSIRRGCADELAHYTTQRRGDMAALWGA